MDSRDYEDYKPLTVGELIEVLKQYNSENDVCIVLYKGVAKYLSPIVKARIEAFDKYNRLEIDITQY